VLDLRNTVTADVGMVQLATVMTYSGFGQSLKEIDLTITEPMAR